MRALAALAGLAAAISYGILLWIGITQLMPAADGLRPFDLRVFGYDMTDATTYLEALGEEGRALIEGPVRTWDTVFPVAFTLFLALVSLRGGGKLGWIGAVLALGYGAADLIENAAILQLVRGPVPPDQLMVSSASLLTQAKFALVALALLLGIVARVRRGRRA